MKSPASFPEFTTRAWAPCKLQGFSIGALAHWAQIREVNYDRFLAAFVKSRDSGKGAHSDPYHKTDKH